jgi:hypothetical protein
MKDFFRVMGKAFAVVFGSASALALVLGLCALGARQLLKPELRARQEVPVSSVSETTANSSDVSHVAPGKPEKITNIRPIGFICRCVKSGCYVCDSTKTVLAFLPDTEVSEYDERGNPVGWRTKPAQVTITPDTPPAQETITPDKPRPSIPRMPKADAPPWEKYGGPKQ